MKLHLFIITFILLSMQGFGQLTKQLDSVLQRHVQTGGPGIALQIEKDGKLLYQQGLGSAELSTGKIITPSTNFRMASVSKQFTAMAILLLEKDHKLSFDDPLSKYLPEVSPKVASRVLIRHLLTHSSGIIDYEAVMDNKNKIQLLDKDVLNLIKNVDSTYFEPGKRFKYSNSAYCLLALIVEKVAGEPFRTFIKSRIFDPLDMSASSVYEAEKSIPNRAMGYARNKQGNIKFSDQSLTSATKGDGGVYTSLVDYQKWIHALWTNKLLNFEQTLERLKFPIAQTPGRFYSAGWFEAEGNAPSYFHSGSTCGFSTFSIHIPQQRLSIVYFSNLAGNTKPFREVLNTFEKNGYKLSFNVFELHELTQ